MVDLLRRRPRLALLGALVALALSAAGATAAPGAPGPAAPPSLAGSVTLTGSQSGYVTVVVPRMARLGDPLFDQRKQDTAVAGGGRVTGFALVPAHRESDDARAALVAARFDFLDRQGARKGQPLMLNLGQGFTADGLDYLVPKGTYRLYLITDGRPATVTLRLRGLSGKASLAPRVRTPLTVQDGGGGLDVRTDAGRTAHTAGDDFAFERPTLSFSTFTMKHDVHTESAYTTCIHTAEPKGPNPYLPGCPSTGEGSRLMMPFVISDEYVQPDQLRAVYGGFVAERGHFGVGGSLLTASPAEDLGYSHLWLGL